MNELYRSKQNKMIAGVCGGLGEKLGIDPSVVRLAAILVGIYSAGIAILVYILWALFTSAHPSPVENLTYRKLYRSRNSVVAGLCRGVAEYLEISTGLLRILFLICLFLTAFLPLFIAYLVGWFVIPKRPKDEDAEIIV